MNNTYISRRGVLRGLGGGFAATAGIGQTSADSDDEVLIGVDGRGPAKKVARQAKEHRKTIDLGDVRQVVLGRFTEEALKGLRNNRHVRYIEPNNAKYHALAQTLPWGIDRVDADIVHDSGETGSGADIAIIDTGIDDDHEDLQANIGAGKAFTECSGSNCNYSWSDDNDHGTHCAGIADAVDNSAGVVGASTEATLHAVKVLASDGSGTLSDVASGIKHVADQGWDVGSLSLGASSGDQTLQDACQYAHDNGVLLVGAAGNDGPCSDCVSYPAAYSTVIAVSSTDEDDTLSSFSSTGADVELAAPGGSVYSAVIGGYDTFSGTSMACPHVSGAGGQLMANGLSNTEARDRLQATAEDIGLGTNEQGYGLLDAESAIITGFLVATDAPTNVDSSSATLNGSLETLDDASSADVYFEWRETGASAWNTTNGQTLSSTGSFSEDISGLSIDVEYEYRAVGDASDGDTDTGATLTFTASDCVDATRWPAGSGSSGEEYITTMDIDGQVVESSSDGAYYDFTCPDVVTVQQGGSFDVAMNFEDAGYDSHYGNVYVDWEQNHDWVTATETQLMENVSDDTVTYTATVPVPSGAATGGTLARVRLSWSDFSGPTAADEYGEVEDFTIFVEASSTDSAPAVDSLSATEIETSDSDAAFDVDWQVSDADSNLDSVDLTLTEDTDGETEDSAAVSVSGDSASGTTRLIASSDEGSENSYTVELIASDADGNTDSATVTVSESESAPSVDSLSASEVETSASDAEFDVDWQVSDSDGDLASVDLTLMDDTDGETEDSVSVSVSGEYASGTTRLIAAGDDGAGNSYTVDLATTDSDGTTAVDSATVSETDDTSDDTAPGIESYTVTEAGSPNPHAEITAEWSVSDTDGDLSLVDVTVYDSTGDTVDSSITPVSGASASGIDQFKIKHVTNETFEVVLTVTDVEDNSTAASQTVTE